MLMNVGSKKKKVDQYWKINKVKINAIVSEDLKWNSEVVLESKRN